MSKQQNVKRKTMDDVAQDLSELVESFKAKAVERADADTTVNIYGKIISVEKIQYQQAEFADHLRARAGLPPWDEQLEKFAGVRMGSTGGQQEGSDSA